MYLQSDLFATRLQHYYQTDMGYKKTKLNTASLNGALQHFGMHASAEIVLMLFQGGEGKRGNKSAKQLRNGYLHQLSEADRNEIISKAPLLIKEMKKFIKMRINT